MISARKPEATDEYYDPEAQFKNLEENIKAQMFLQSLANEKSMSKETRKKFSESLYDAHSRYTADQAKRSEKNSEQNSKSDYPNDKETR